MNLLPLAARLEEKQVGHLGKTLFVNMIPATCSQGILLRNNLTGTHIDYELPNYYRASFQVIARAGNYPTGEVLMKAAFTALTMQEQRVGDMHFIYCRPQTEPVVFPLSKGNLLEFSAYFDVAFFKIA